MAYLGKELIGLGIEPNSVGILELDVGSGVPGYSLKISSANTLMWGPGLGDNVTDYGVWENSAVIDMTNDDTDPFSKIYTIASGNNALSAGPITIAAGYSIILPAGSTWAIT
jgi:hypothetical protein